MTNLFSESPSLRVGVIPHFSVLLENIPFNDSTSSQLILKVSILASQHFDGILFSPVIHYCVFQDEPVLTFCALLGVFSRQCIRKQCHQCMIFSQCFQLSEKKLCGFCRFLNHIVLW